MAQVYRAIGVGQGTGYQDSSFLLVHIVCLDAVSRANIAMRNYGMPASQAVVSAKHIPV